MYVVCSVILDEYHATLHEQYLESKHRLLALTSGYAEHVQWLAWPCGLVPRPVVLI